MALDIDLLLDQGNYTDDVEIEPIDWEQWDSLLRDWKESSAEI
jgi:hypothetical protein